MQRTLPKFIPSLILVGCLFTMPLRLKRALHISTAKHHPATPALMAAEELFPILNSCNLIMQPGECQKRYGSLPVGQPLSLQIPSLWQVFLGEDRDRESWAERGAEEGFTKHPAHPCVCQQRQHSGGCRQYLPWGCTRDTDNGGSVIQKCRQICSL